MSTEPGAVEEYFRAIEDTFIRLRGAPLLLSPADWKTAESWHDEGVPLELVERVLEEVFERLRERDPERRIHGLRYCAPAVEAAWREVKDLTATAGRLEPEPIDVESRLARLAEALRRAPVDVEEIERRLAALGGGAETVESRLEELDRAMLDLCVADLDEATRRRLEERSARALERAGERLESEDAADLGRRLIREGARRELGLPTLSLFASDAEPEPGGGESTEPDV